MCIRDSIYCAQIGAGSSYTWKFSVNALTTAQSRPHPAVIAMEYEDSAGQPCSASDRIILQVRQPVRLEYEEPALPPRVTPVSYTHLDVYKRQVAITNSDGKSYTRRNADHPRSRSASPGWRESGKRASGGFPF